MPDSTPIFDLPYPTGSDAPCDFDEQWCDFTEAIAEVFSTFDEGLDRTNPIIPMAMVRQTGPVVVSNLVQVPFDTVVVDTAGMTDIDADPFSIRTTRTGRYTVAAYLNLNDPNISLNAEISLLVNGSSYAFAQTIYRGVIQYRMSAYNAVETISAGTNVQILFNTGAAGSYTVNNAWWAVAWHADTEVS